eukprot:1188631-Prorocentrum_minimum.AAC.1
MELPDRYRQLVVELTARPFDAINFTDGCACSSDGRFDGGNCVVASGRSCRRDADAYDSTMSTCARRAAPC